MRKYDVFESPRFRKDKERARRRGLDVSMIDDVVNRLANGERLPPQYKDHPLKGDQLGRRECRVDGKPKGDWLLVYRKIEEVLLLYLVGTGTHVDLGLDK